MFSAFSHASQLMIPRSKSRPATHRRAWLAAAGAALVFAACSDTLGPLPREGAPDVLEFGIGGFGAGSSSVKLRGDTVVFYHAPWGEASPSTLDSSRVVPSADAWRAFWNAADDAGVRRWRARYVAENVVDGAGWSLRLTADDVHIESSGSNAYPDRLGREHELASTPEFERFAAAVWALAGRQP